jgi:hypothetical protein
MIEWLNDWIMEWICVCDIGSELGDDLWQKSGDNYMRNISVDLTWWSIFRQAGHVYKSLTHFQIFEFSTKIREMSKQLSTLRNDCDKRDFYTGLKTFSVKSKWLIEKSHTYNTFDWIMTQDSLSPFKNFRNDCDCDCDWDCECEKGTRIETFSWHQNEMTD